MQRKFRYVPVDRALRDFMKAVKLKLSYETLPLYEAYGRVLANELIAAKDIPKYDMSHFDGYAIRAGDTALATVNNPVSFRVVGRTRPGGRLARKVGPEEVCYVTTGAYLPEGTDAVVSVEAATAVAEDVIEVRHKIQLGEHVIPQGKDVKKGETVLEKGHALRAQDIGFLAALGISQVKVVKKPIVAILSVGDELTDRFDEVGKTFSSHALIFSKLVGEEGGVPIYLGIAPDDKSKIQSKIRNGLKKADMILTIAGVSKGDKDYVPATIEAMGKPGIVVRGIDIRPGRASGAGIINGRPIIMLPGLIQSALVCFYVFALPLIRLMSGLSSSNLWTIIKARIAERLVFTEFIPFKKVTFVRVVRTPMGIVARPFTGESALLGIVVKANGFIITPENRTLIEEGEEVDVHLLPTPLPYDFLRE